MKNKEYKNKNKEKYDEYFKKYREQNRDKHKEYMKKYEMSIKKRTECKTIGMTIPVPTARQNQPPNPSNRVSARNATEGCG